MTQQYEVLSLIWHTKDREHYQSGAIVSMDHLPQITVDDLVQRGILRPVATKPKAPKPKEQEKKE
jgi:hypothetical protein